MELSHLQAFVGVADAGGFSRAAAVLLSTQPTLSRQVKALETELGRALFDRLGRRVELTAYGRECLDKARAILTASENLAASGRDRAGRATGLLRLGVADSVVLRRFPQILKRFQRLEVIGEPERVEHSFVHGIKGLQVIAHPKG